MSTRKTLTPEKLIELHVRENLSLTEIGKIYGISRQRVHQIKRTYEKEYGKINRRINIDVMTLKHYLEKGWTAKRIAEYLDIKASKVSRLIRKYKEEYEVGVSNIRISRKKAQDIISKEEMAELYLEKLLTDKEIAEMYQVSPSTINLLRKQYKIPTINTKSLRKLHIELTKPVFERLYVLEGYTLKEIAEKHNCNIISIIRLKEVYEIKKKR